MYMLCMVGSGNGASKWAEMLIGHVWGGPVVGTTAQKLAHLYDRSASSSSLLHHQPDSHFHMLSGC